MVKPKCLKAKISVKSITIHMASKEALDNIKDLIISSTEKGSQDNHFVFHVSFYFYFYIFICMNLYRINLANI